MWSKDNLSKGWKIPQICTLWKNPVVTYKESDILIIPRYNGIVSRYKLSITPGERYGNLIIISDAEPKILKSGLKKRMVKCKCDCGVIKDICLNSIKNKNTKSCGCLQKIKSSEYNSKHIKM
jgi:hypothetical protein